MHTPVLLGTKVSARGATVTRKKMPADSFAKQKKTKSTTNERKRKEAKGVDGLDQAQVVHGPRCCTSGTAHTVKAEKSIRHKAHSTCIVSGHKGQATER